MRRLILPPLRPLDFLDCGHDPLPDGATVHIALLQHGVRPLGSLQGGARAVLAKKDVGRAKYIDIIDHRQLDLIWFGSKL